MEWMSHRKRREIKQQPSMLPGPAVPGSCLVYFCLMCDIHCVQESSCMHCCKKERKSAQPAVQGIGREWPRKEDYRGLRQPHKSRRSLFTTTQKRKWPFYFPSLPHMPELEGSQAKHKSTWRSELNVILIWYLVLVEGNENVLVPL